MVEEGAGAGFHVFDVPLSVRLPEFAVLSRHDFRFETDGWDGVGAIVKVCGVICLISFAVAAYADYARGGSEGASHSLEVQGRALVRAVHVWDEAY